MTKRTITTPDEPRAINNIEAGISCKTCNGLGYIEQPTQQKLEQLEIKYHHNEVGCRNGCLEN